MCNVSAAIDGIAEMAAKVQLSVGDYAPIRYSYKMECEGYITEYLYTDNVRVTKFKSNFKKAIVGSFYPAFEQGLIDGGGEAPAQGDDLEWINARVEREFAFVDELFQYLKDLKKQAKEEGIKIYEGVAGKRAENYARTLDGVYSTGKMRGAKNQMLTFGGEDGQESCPECQKMRGKRHRASWWIGHGLVPGIPGSVAYSCHGYNCKHFLYNSKGEVFTLTA
jgi:hypothetical protein